MKVIFATFFNTLNALMNVGGLLFLIIYIYAVIGINLFGDIKMKPPMHERLNFQSVWSSFFTLIRVATGEAWNDLMDALSKGKTIDNDCIEGPSYDDYVNAGY
jgi:hypothetical protein